MLHGLNRLVQREQLGKNLIGVETSVVDGTGSAGTHAEAAAFAEYRVDPSLAGIPSFLDE